jgi:hypothetical protein
MRVNLFFVLLSFFAIGCVGTIENSQTPVSETQSPVPGSITFPGIFSIKKVSDSRLEIYFPEATGGSGKYIYDVYIGSDRVESYPDEVLSKDQGFYQLLLSGFSVFSQVAIRVEARDANANALSTNGLVKKETTFGNETCRFDGIVDVSNIAGESGKDSLKIKWVPAEIISIGHEANPISYEIVLIKRGKTDGSGLSIGKDQMDTATDGRYVFTIPWDDGINEYTVRGLSSDYKYLARVRCIHSSSENNNFYPELRSELNNKTIEKATLNDSYANMTGLNTLALTPTNLPGQAGLMGLNLAWTQISGAFDHFRIYFSTLNTAPTITSDCNPSNCKKERYDALASAITGLSPHTTYYLRLVICGNPTCSTNFTSSSVSIKTTPSLASFGGISGIDLNYNLESIGSATLRFVLPDFSNGYAEKYQLSIKKGDGVFEKLEDQSFIKLDENYNLSTATTLNISGIEMGSTEKYCFKLNLKIGDNLDENTVQKCVDVSGSTSDTAFIAPSKDHFPGILGMEFNSGLIIKWKKPTKGFYSSYKVYVSTLPTFDLASTTTFELDRDLYESQLVNNVTIMQGTFPANISGTTKYYLKMKTIFPNPYISGEFPSEENLCSWQCNKQGLNVVCAPLSPSCPILN